MSHRESSRVNSPPAPTSVKVVLLIYALLCLTGGWQFFGSGQTQAAVLLAICLLIVNSLAFAALLRSPAIAVWMAASLAMCVTVFLLLGRRDAREYFRR